MIRFRPFLFAIAALMTTVAGARAQEVEGAPSGTVSTTKPTLLKTGPAPQAPVIQTLDPNVQLRWVMGQKRGNYVRVMVPKGPSGWVRQSDINVVQNAPQIDIAEEAQAQPCQASLSACMARGCAAADSAHAAINQAKRAKPQAGEPVLVTFETFSTLQEQARQLVDEGQEIDPADRLKIRQLHVPEGDLGEGTLVRLIAFLSEGKPHPNTGESVNCNLKGPGNNDIHIPVSEVANDSEFNGIVVEMIPQDRSSKWTQAALAKVRGKMLMIDGGLLYDNMHFANGDANNPLPGQPKRFSLWEIHPVTSFKVCNKKPAQCDPNRATDWTPLESM